MAYFDEKYEISHYNHAKTIVFHLSNPITK